MEALIVSRPEEKCSVGPLGLTYYDVLRVRRPRLFSVLADELAPFAANPPKHPLTYPEELPQLPRYLKLVQDEILDNTRESLRAQGYFNVSDAALVPVLESPLLERVLASAQFDYMAMANFLLYGRKTFHITDSLVEHLACTDLDAPAEYVRPPFDTAQFVFTSPLAREALYRIGDAGSYNPPTTPISVFVSNRAAADGTRTISFLCWHADTDRFEFFAKRSLLVRPDWSIEKMLKTDWRDIYQDEEDPGELVDETRFYTDGLLFFRIVINSILYLGSNEQDLISVLSPRAGVLESNSGPARMKRKREREARRVTDLSYTAVGSRLDSIIVEKPIADSLTSGEVTRPRKLGVRFLVRGHWRQQPHGPQSQFRKLIWIKPYPKGPDMADLVNKPYEVR